MNAHELSAFTAVVVNALSGHFPPVHPPIGPIVVGPILTRDGRVIAVVSWNLAAVGFEGLAFGVPVEAVSRRLLLDWR